MPRMYSRAEPEACGPADASHGPRLDDGRCFVPLTLCAERWGAKLETTGHCGAEPGLPGAGRLSAGVCRGYVRLRLVQA
jgi:hypothetical protein